jgi:hypothetical protein
MRRNADSSALTGRGSSASRDGRGDPRNRPTPLLGAPSATPPAIDRSPRGRHRRAGAGDSGASDPRPSHGGRAQPGPRRQAKVERPFSGKCTGHVGAGATISHGVWPRSPQPHRFTKIPVAARDGPRESSPFSVHPFRAPALSPACASTRSSSLAGSARWWSWSAPPVRRRAAGRAAGVALVHQEATLEQLVEQVDVDLGELLPQPERPLSYPTARQPYPVRDITIPTAAWARGAVRRQAAFS